MLGASVEKGKGAEGERVHCGLMYMLRVNYRSKLLEGCVRKVNGVAT